MARRRSSKGRDLNGILLLDKAIGVSSNFVLQQAKKMFCASKAGHTGSLDPLATGLLPICFGDATKMSAYLLDSEKKYVAECRLGIATTSGDADGEVKQKLAVPVLSERLISQVLKEFLGASDQIPPMHSALKQNGQPLYKLAHKGLEVAREARKINVFALDLVQYNAQSITFEVHCSKGTYVRTLAEDIATALGTCGHVTKLRRLKVGFFDLNDSFTLDELAETLALSGVDELDRRLLPVDSALEGWPSVDLNEDAAFYVKQGQAVTVPKVPTAGLVKLYQNGGVFIGIGKILDDGRVAPKRLLSM